MANYFPLYAPGGNGPLSNVPMSPYATPANPYAPVAPQPNRYKVPVNFSPSYSGNNAGEYGADRLPSTPGQGNVRLQYNYGSNLSLPAMPTSPGYPMLPVNTGTPGGFGQYAPVAAPARGSPEPRKMPVTPRPPLGTSGNIPASNNYYSSSPNYGTYSAKDRAKYQPAENTGPSYSQKYGSSASYNAPGNQYTPIMQAMSFGGYGGAMGAPVTGLPQWDKNGQPMQQQQAMSGFDAWRRQKYGQSGNFNGGNLDAAGQAHMAEYQNMVAQQAEANMPIGQRLLRDVQNQANTAKAANEQRYDAILNRDQPAMQQAMRQQLMAQYPNMKPEMIDKMLADPRRVAEFQAQNPQFGGYRDRYTRGMGYLRGAGEQARKDINTDYQNLNNKTQMNLAQRGLDSSTISGSMAAGVERQRQDSVGRLNEQLRKEYMDADARLSGDTLSFMERRNDTYPDQMQIADLMMKFGNAGMLGGGGGGYGGYGQPVLQYSGTQASGTRPDLRTGTFGQPTYSPRFY
jgi:hypothetical protein